MSLNRREAQNVAKSENESTLVYDNLPVGDNEGRLCYVADLGLQDREYKGEFKGSFQQIALGIEMVGQPMKDEEGNDIPRILWTKPFYIYDKMGEKGKEYAYYSAFDTSAQPETVPDWDAQLGKPISVVVEHNPGKGENAGREYDNIKTLNPIPAKYQDGVEKATLTPAIGDADDPENVVTKALYGLVKHVYDKRVQGDSQPTPASQSQQGGKQDDFDDDTPY